MKESGAKELCGFKYSQKSGYRDRCELAQVTRFREQTFLPLFSRANNFPCIAACANGSIQSESLKRRSSGKGNNIRSEGSRQRRYLRKL